MPKRTETPLTYKTKQGLVLTEKEYSFCYEWVTNGYNGTRAALKAYDCESKDKDKKENTAASIAKENLRKPQINQCIKELLGINILDSDDLDRELAIVVVQNQDLGNKVRAIDLCNKLGGRYEEDNKQKKPEVQINNIDLSKLDDTDLNRTLSKIITGK